MEKYTIKELGEFINAINKNPDRCGGIASAFNGNGGLTLTIIPPASEGADKCKKTKSE